MDAQNLALNIAVNLGRISRWAMEGRQGRVQQFLLETDEYVEQLAQTPQGPRFLKTFQTFKLKFDHLKNDIHLDADWAEEMLTWANILTHRAKLA